METPYGHLCKYYYEDWHRGRSRQECRLTQAGPTPRAWQPGLCSSCPVPGILRANACPNMVLEGRVTKRWLGLARKIEVYAVCTLKAVEVAEPHVGCGECNVHRPGAAIWDAIGSSDPQDTPHGT